MRLAKRGALAHEIVGEVGRHHGAGQRRTHALRAEAALGQRSGRRGEHEQQRIGGVEQVALVVLQILVVARRQSLERREQRREVAEHARRRASRQLERIGVAFLWHHAGTTRVAFAELHEAELAGPVDDEVLGEARQMGTDHRRGEEDFGDEIAIADGVNRVRRDRVETERALEQDARDGIGAAGHGSGAERKHRGRLRGGAQARAIALEWPEVREEPMRPRHGDRSLHVCV